MKINRYKLEMVLARNCKSLSDFRQEGLSPLTLTRIRAGADVKPVTAGKLAAALGVDPEEIVEQEEA